MKRMGKYKPRCGDLRDGVLTELARKATIIYRWKKVIQLPLKFPVSDKPSSNFHGTTPNNNTARHSCSLFPNCVDSLPLSMSVRQYLSFVIVTVTHRTEPRSRSVENFVALTPKSKTNRHTPCFRQTNPKARRTSSEDERWALRPSIAAAAFKYHLLSRSSVKRLHYVTVDGVNEIPQRDALAVFSAFMHEWKFGTFWTATAPEFWVNARPATDWDVAGIVG